MERLTERCPEGIRIKGCSTLYADKERKGTPALNAIVRLAAYEDTDLEPEEVKEFLEDVETRFVNWINKRYGIPVMKFTDIMDAEKNGRLVVLPDARHTDADGEKLCREAKEENPPLTLEQLQRMDGEPVFCASKTVPENSAWGIVCMRENVPYVRTTQNKGKVSRFFYLDDYGSAWIAYPRAPKMMDAVRRSSDYKELIEWLRHTVEHGDEEPREYCTNMCGRCEMCDQAADALETLLAERDAAVENLRGDCHACKHNVGWHNVGKCCTCIHETAGPLIPKEQCNDNWQWRGPTKGE